VTNFQKLFPVKIDLIHNKGFKWFSNENIFVKGCFFDEKSNFYEKDALLNYFSDIKTEKDFKIKISNANGIFTVIINSENQIFTANDTSRIFPLFYTIKHNNFYLSDDVFNLINKTGEKEINDNSLTEFFSAGYTSGNKTLLKNIFQTQSNEYLIIDKTAKNFKSEFFYSYAADKIHSASYNNLKISAINATENAFKRMINSLNNRQVVLPLSGGYDSRLIALMLKKYHYQNVLCFTFGKKNNFELENSEKTAKLLGFNWIFIEYTSELINNYLETKTFKEYVNYTGKFSSMPFLQEYFAVKYLKDNKLIDENSIFIPGHSGDLLGGSQFVKVIPDNLKISDIPKLILKKKFFYNTLSSSQKRVLKKTIKHNLFKFNPDYKNKIAYTVFEDYDIKEKITKFIFNSTSVFNFFGYEQRFPYWDKELLNFYKTLPAQYKKMKLLYDEILTDHFFKPNGLNFEKEIQSSLFTIKIQKIKNKIKPLLPTFLMSRILSKTDWKNYKKITDKMLFSMKQNKYPVNFKIKKYNEIIIRWYLSFIENILK